MKKRDRIDYDPKPVHPYNPDTYGFHATNEFCMSDNLKDWMASKWRQKKKQAPNLF